MYFVPPYVFFFLFFFSALRFANARILLIDFIAGRVLSISGLNVKRVVVTITLKIALIISSFILDFFLTHMVHTRVLICR